MESIGDVGSEIFTGIVMLWLGLAYMTGTMASSKGYNFWLGFIGGIVAWVPKLIVLLVIEPKGKPIHVPSATALKRLGTHKTCYVCGKVNGVNAIHCRKCGMAFPFTNSSKTAVETMFLTDDVREEVNEGQFAFANGADD